MKQLKQRLLSGAFDASFAMLYSKARVESSRRRAICVVDAFMAAFPDNTGAAALFSAPGRTELGGNHTDHQHGCVLCGSVDLDMLACAAPNGTNRVRVISEGFHPLEVMLEVLKPQTEEINTSAALVRGIAAKISGLGHRINGFDAYVTSDVLSGSGLSSSAAYEVMIGTIFNHFFCGDLLTPVQIAQIGQWAENRYFGKPCGLMDQMACAVGGAVAIDFTDPNAPAVKKVEFDFCTSGHALCIVDTASSHGDLTDDYAAIPREMAAIAAHFGKTVLRDVPEDAFGREVADLRRVCGDRAVLRAMHFYQENRRAQQEAQALEEGNFPRFLSLVSQSGLSSELLLQNVWSPNAPQMQAVSLALAVGRALLDGAGAIRVHGGGFAGTIQAFVPMEKLTQFRQGMEKLLGVGTCHVLQIRPLGGIVLA